MDQLLLFNASHVHVDLISLYRCLHSDHWRSASSLLLHKVAQSITALQGLIALTLLMVYSLLMALIYTLLLIIISITLLLFVTNLYHQLVLAYIYDTAKFV